MEWLKDIFSQIYDYDMLLDAYEKAVKDEMYNKEGAIFATNLEENLINIQNHLIYKTYEVGLIKVESKSWLFTPLPLSDQIVQWAFQNVVKPIFEESLSWYDKVLPPKLYSLKVDVSGCFFQADHDILLEIMERKIDDADLAWLTKKIISCEQRFGLPSMCLISNFLEEIYLSEIDHYAVEELGISYYRRNSGQIVVVADGLAEIHQIKDDLKNCFENAFRLNFVSNIDPPRKI